MNTYQQEMIVLAALTLSVMVFVLYNFEPGITKWLDNIILWFKGRRFWKRVPMRAKRRHQ